MARVSMGLRVFCTGIVVVILSGLLALGLHLRSLGQTRIRISWTRWHRVCPSPPRAHARGLGSCGDTYRFAITTMQQQIGFPSGITCYDVSCPGLRGNPCPGGPGPAGKAIGLTSGASWKRHPASLAGPSCWDPACGMKKALGRGGEKKTTVCSRHAHSLRVPPRRPRAGSRT